MLYNSSCKIKYELHNIVQYLNHVDPYRVPKGIYTHCHLHVMNAANGERPPGRWQTPMCVLAKVAFSSHIQFILNTTQMLNKFNILLVFKCTAKLSQLLVWKMCIFSFSNYQINYQSFSNYQSNYLIISSLAKKEYWCNQ